ncbi:MAG: DUF2914 domain-containing protein [Methylobacter sp.]
MTDKRNIVIKVKYPVSGKAAKNIEPKIITEWDVKKILIAAGILVFILVALFYLISKDTQRNDSDNAELAVNTIEKNLPLPPENTPSEIKKPDISKPIMANGNPPIKPPKELAKKIKPTDDITTKKAITKSANEKVIKEPGYPKTTHNLTRAVLVYDINNKEPAGEIGRTVTINKRKPTWVYYFTELKSMNGRRVYHEWLKNGALVSKQKLIISGDVWRTSSRKLLNDSEKGNWAVRLVDEHGQLLNEKTFKVE